MINTQILYNIKVRVSCGISCGAGLRTLDLDLKHQSTSQGSSRETWGYRRTPQTRSWVTPAPEYLPHGHLVTHHHDILHLIDYHH